MKKNYLLSLPIIAVLLLGQLLFFQHTAYSQATEPVSIGTESHVVNFDNALHQKPVQHHLTRALTPQEMHVLGELTPAERTLIEGYVEPLAVGVVRDLKEPIRFSLSEINIPAQGEVSVSGGRLARINEDTIVWTTCIKSAKADELRIFFSEGNFPDGVKVNFFSKDGYAFNQFDLRGMLKEDGFYTTTTFADYVFMEVVIPVRLITENLYFVVPKVVHSDSRYMPDAPLDCYQDVNCSYANGYGDIGSLKASTAKLSFVVSGVNYICSGGLLNDARGIDWQPFLLTANHCFSSQASATSLEARFDLFSTSCNGGTNPNVVLVNGSSLIATNSGSDFTMVLLNQFPSGYRAFLGWTTGAVADNETMHSVNHPAGMPQKYVRVANDYSPAYNCTGFSTSNFHYTNVLGGQTTGGSSGGLIVNSGGGVVGQLYGTCHGTTWGECNYGSFNNMWGRFNVSYNNNNLQYWLNGGGSSVYMSTSTSSLSYATLNVGSYQDLTVTVYNDGYIPYYLNLEAGNAYISGADASQFSIIGTSYLYLSPSTSGTFTVRFAPTSSGAKSASLNIPHNANNIVSPKVISLSGAAEPCSNIISLGTGGTANAKTYSKSGSGIWYTTFSPCGSWSCPGNEQIYSFTAPYTGYYSIAVSASNSHWIDYMWKTSCDGGVWTCIDDAYYPGTYGSIYWTAGSTYYILADAESTALTTQTFYVFLNPCLNTVSIGGTGPDYSQTYNGGGTGGWNSNIAGPCSWLCPGVESVYSFVAPYTGYYSLNVSSTTEYYVDYAWSTSCGSTGWNCIQDVLSPGNYGNMFWTAGTTYYILLDDENGVVGPQTFYINEPNPCQGIISLACNQSVAFAGGGPGVWGYNPCYSSPGFEQIYSFVAPTTGQYSIEVNAAGSWVDYLWKAGSCSAGDWNCISYVQSPGQYGSMEWTAGTTYYIMLDDEDTYAGIHSFKIICPELCHTCPVYDYQISPNETWQLSSSSIDSYGCKNYKFYAYTGYSYTFKTGCGDGATANYDSYLQVLDASCAEVAYNDDGCDGTLSKIEWTPVASGYYTLKVLGYSSNFGSYTLAYNMCYTAPAMPDLISGPAVIGEGTEQSYSIPEVYGATSYTWSFSGTGIITGSGTSIILSATSDGVLSVTANNLCGSSSPYQLGITVIPQFVYPANIVITPGSTVCYAATQTITVAGGGSYYYVLNGGSAEFVAGQNIFFMPGLTVYSGGHLLGRITTTDTYCTPVVAKSVENGIAGTAGNEMPAIIAGDSFFKVYPNPTSGAFTLELSAEPEGELVKVQCYNLLGALIIEKEFETGKRHEFTLANQAPGLYVLKVTQNNRAGMQKIVRQ